MKKFIQDVFILQSGALGTAILGFITSFWVAKILQPSNYGIYALVFSIYSLVGMFGNLGAKQTTLVKLPLAYINQDRQEVLSILTYYFKVSLIIGISIMIIGYIAAPYLSKFLYGREDIGRLSRILFLMPPLIILYKLVRETLEGTRNMKYLAILESSSEIIKSVILIVLVSLGLGLTTLIYGWVFASIASSILAVFVYKKLELVRKGLPSISEIVKKSHIHDNWHFLRFNLSMGLSENIINLNENLPIVLLGIFVLPQEVGHFKLGYSIMGLSTLLLEPIARNLSIKLIQLPCSHGIKRLSETFYKVSLYTGIISITLVIAIIILCHFFIYFFLKDYKPTLKIMYILAVYFCLMGFGIGLSPILRALQRLDIEIKINSIGLLIFIALSILLIKNLGILGMAIALVISALITKSITYLWIKNKLNRLGVYE